MDYELRLHHADDYAASKGLALKNYFLDSIRRGQARNITAELGGPEYIREMEALFGRDLSLAHMAYTFVWAQAQRAAVEGGMTEESALAIYSRYILEAQRITSIGDFARLNIQALVEFAEAVSGTEEDPHLSPLVRRCRMYIREHVYEQVTVNQVAEAMHFSRSRLAHIFKNETGKTLMDVIQEEKIAEAARLIESSPFSLTEIALKLGYCSQSHFTRVFRKITGATPGEWRRARGSDEARRDKEDPDEHHTHGPG